MNAQLSGIALFNKILPIQIGNPNPLAPEIKRIQAAVGIFFQHVEIGHVVLIFIVLMISKQANPEVVIKEDQPAKIAVKLLDSSAQ